MSDNDQQIIPVTENVEYPMGRHLWHDPQNKQHRAFAAVGNLPDRYKMWYSPDVYDQQGSSCTMQSCIGHCRTTPNRKPFTPFWPEFDTEAERHAGYLVAQNYDPWPGGEPQYAGSSSDAPLKMLREQGRISGWKWLFGITEVKQWIMYYGSCGVGTIWFNSMFTVDKNGYMVVDPNSGVAGGHAYRIIGYSLKRRAFRIVNSWGRDWGENGRAWLREEDLDLLLQQQGEAVTVVL